MDVPFREYLFDGVGQRFAGSLFSFLEIDHIPDFAEHGRNGNAPAYRRIALSGLFRFARYKGAPVFVFDPHRSEFSSAHTGIEQHKQSYDEKLANSRNSANGYKIIFIDENRSLYCSNRSGQ